MRLDEIKMAHPAQETFAYPCLDGGLLVATIAERRNLFDSEASRTFVSQTWIWWDYISVPQMNEEAQRRAVASLCASFSLRAC